MPRRAWFGLVVVAVGIFSLLAHLRIRSISTVLVHIPRPILSVTDWWFFNRYAVAANAAVLLAGLILLISATFARNSPAKKTVPVVLITAIFIYALSLLAGFYTSLAGLDCIGIGTSGHSVFDLFLLWNHPNMCFAGYVRSGMGVAVSGTLVFFTAIAVAYAYASNRNPIQWVADAYPASAVMFLISAFIIVCLIQPALFGIAFGVVGIIVSLIIIVYIAGHLPLPQRS